MRSKSCHEPICLFSLSRSENKKGKRLYRYYANSPFLERNTCEWNFWMRFASNTWNYTLQFQIVNMRPFADFQNNSNKSITEHFSLVHQFRYKHSQKPTFVYEVCIHFRIQSLFYSSAYLRVKGVGLSSHRIHKYTYTSSTEHDLATNLFWSCF